MKALLWIGMAVLAALVPTSVLADEFYRHVGENGNITYSDRPASANEAPLDIGPPNVTTPEATRQIYQIQQQERTEEALRVQYQQDSINAAEDATEALIREHYGNRAARRWERQWCMEGASGGGTECPAY